jgi:hypothetical protein
MKEATSIVQFRQPGSVEDPLTEIAWEGARRMLVTAPKPRLRLSSTGLLRSGCRMVGSAWFGMDTGPSGRSRPGSAPFSSGARRSGTAPRTRR